MIQKIHCKKVGDDVWVNINTYRNRLNCLRGIFVVWIWVRT